MKLENSQPREDIPRTEKRTRRPGRVLTALGSAVTAISLLGSAAPAAATERQSASKSIEAKEKKAKEDVFAPVLQTSSDPQELIKQTTKNFNKYYKTGDVRYLDYALYGTSGTTPDGASTPVGEDFAVILADLDDTRDLTGDKTYTIKYTPYVLASKSTEGSIDIIAQMTTKRVGKILGKDEKESWYHFPYELKQLPDPATGEFVSVWLPTESNKITESLANQMAASPEYQ